MSSPDFRTPTLPGRDGDLSALRSALRRAEAGTPQAVVVEGGAGMGKTTLLNHFADEIQERARVSRFVCDRFEADEAYGMAGIMLGREFAADTAPSAVGSALLGWLGEMQQDDLAAVLLIDDAQWLDTPSAHALRFAIRRLAADRVLAVISRRPATRDDAWVSLLANPQRAERRVLHELSAVDITDLGRLAGDVTLTTQDAERVEERTGGVPLLVAAHLRSMRGDPRTADGSLGGSVDQVVNRLASGLDGSARALMDALAVLEVPSPLLTASAVAQLSDATEALDAAVTAGLLQVTAETGLVSFTHPVLREAVYEQLDLVERRALHHEASRWTSGERQLDHRVAAADRDDPDLAATLIAAAESDSRSGRHLVAARHLLAARQVTADPERRNELAERALLHRLSARDLAAAEAVVEDVRGAPHSARRALALGKFERERGEIGAAEVLLRTSLQEATKELDDSILEHATIELGSLYTALARGDEAVELLADTRASQDSEIARSGQLLYGVALWHSGRIVESLEELAGLENLPDDTPHIADLLAARGMIRTYYGDSHGALHDLDLAVRGMQSGATSPTLDMSLVGRAWVRFDTGAWDDAAVDASAALAVAESGEQRLLLPLAHATSALVPAGRGQWEAAEEHLSRAAAPQPVPALSPPQLLGTRAAVFLAMARQDYARVVDLLEPVRRHPAFARLVGTGQYRWIMVNLIEALTTLGAVDQAQRELDDYLRWTRDSPWGIGPARTHRLRALLSQATGDLESAASAFDDELSLDQQHTAPFYRAQNLHCSARIERARGNRRKAIERFQEAYGLFTTLDAAPFATLVAQDLATIGLRLTDSSRPALTAREQDVATTVARGLTNAEAASELFLTPKTVEYHLTNVYAKLGISSRRELRRSVESDDSDQVGTRSRG